MQMPASMNSPQIRTTSQNKILAHGVPLILLLSLLTVTYIVLFPRVVGLYIQFEIKQKNYISDCNSLITIKNSFLINV